MGRGLISELKTTRFVSEPLLSFGFKSWIGFSENQLKNYEGIRPAPDTFVAIKKHLPSSLSKKKKKKKKKKKTTTSSFKPKFLVHSVWEKKSP